MRYARCGRISCFFKKVRYNRRMEVSKMEETISKNKEIALTAAMSALVIILGLPPLHLGLISLGGAAAITIMHVPVLLAFMLLPKIAGLRSGIVVGATFGIFSLINAAVNPAGLLEPLFVHPGVSVLPRVLFAIAGWILWTLLNAIPFSDRAKTPMKIVFAGVVGFLTTLIHTALVIGSLYVFTARGVAKVFGGKGYLAMMGALSVNASIEAATAAFVCFAVLAATTISANRKSRLTSGR